MSATTAAATAQPAATAASTAGHSPATGISSTIGSMPLWAVGVASTVVATVATTLVAVLAKAVDVPLEAAPRTADATEDLPMAAFPMSVLACGAIGVVLALALYRWAKRPARTFVIATVVLTVVSFAGPITTGHATTATRVVLELTHVVAAAIVIPAIAHRLARRPARA